MARPRTNAKTAAGAPSGGAEAVVQRTVNQINPGLEERRTRNLRLDKAYQVWRGEPWIVPGTPPRSVPTWQSRLRVKHAMSIIDQTTASIVQGVPKAKVTPRTPGTEREAVAMEKLLAYYADLDHLAEKDMLIAQLGLVYGMAPAKTMWKYCEEPDTSYQMVQDPETGEITWQPTRRMVVTADRPTMEPWDPYSVFWDPTAGSVDDCAYIVLESWKTRDELEQGRYNEEDGTGQWRNLDLLYQTGDGGGVGSAQAERAQNQLLGEPPGAWRGKFRIWEVWRKTAAGMRLTVIGNRQILLKDGPSPYWMNNYPITLSNSRPDMFKIEGISETEMLDHLQQWLWTIHNLRAEQWKFSVMRGATVRLTVPDMAALVMRPGFLWPVTDHDDVRFQDQPQLPPAAYQEETNAISLMQLISGINQYNTGGAGAEQTTATGASLFTQNASKLLQLKAGVIHSLTWQRTFEQWGMLTKQFLRRSIDVRVVGQGGEVDWVKVGPGEANMDFDIRIQAGDESVTKQQEISNLTMLLNAFAQAASAGAPVNLTPLLVMLAEKAGVPNPESLIAQMQAPPQAAPFGQPNGMPAATPFSLGRNGGAQGIPQIAPQPYGSLAFGNQS